MNTYFADIAPIRYEGPDSKNALSFKQYNPAEKVGQRTMAEHLRFSIAYWHSFCGEGLDPFGQPTLRRPWLQASSAMAAAEQKLQAAFEFITKIGAPYYCFHDRDLAPEGKSLSESHANLEKMCEQALQMQKDTGVKLLWGTANLFSHPRYMCGAATNPDPNVFAYAAAQVKKMIEMTHMLGGENYVFWGGREGYETLLNTDMKREQEHFAAFLHLAVDYAKEIGFTGQMLIEPKPKEPTKHQYDFDVATVIGFLKTYDLADKFKLNIEANHATLAGHSFQHELALASAHGLLGSVDANRGDLLLGWDTDQFPTDIYETISAMLVILQQGGLAPGGLNFDAKVRRTSTDLSDLFHAHIGGMDAFALALRVAYRMQADGVLQNHISKRYAGYDSGIGAKIEKRQASLAELEKHALQSGEPEIRSGQQEKLENIINQYLVSVIKAS
ncbi:xylose isomerase [candidate division KSB1 bacterium]|nr:MAG: xylose isomerase [candidate division KSB1 bacterium]MBC6950086.1 xylose isomerase [candidate division KSB1 bacterium]MCE7944983.1 xylose isomerase [Chlorobi bacterium CHB1]MDL1874968.1 xylose isomerase [Cytophagia bacterium CHB2]